MTVKVDLRPQGLKLAERKKVDLPRVVALALLSVFVVTSSFTVAYGLFILRDLKSQRQLLQESVDRLASENKRLDGYIAENKKRLDQYEKALSMLKQELTSIEFLFATIVSLSDDVWLSQVRQVPGRAEVEGYAFAENDVAAFALKLLNSSVVNTISPLVTTKETKRTKGEQESSLVKFSFSCELKDFMSTHDVAEGAEKDEIKR